ncbi:hypothetical protein BCR33DRAFT_719478 [Rhizoclosmatium globosum]|uniref:Amino acid transporter n=1 Tax=Rhizoclosmatium globosum TaxID=329046 RepID=A0A1Y2C0U3_9FUNG|nr:hypothetical protein BCR33DRAFT_719478 [Rhizoclosmatium globosum]|eukprot:ORY40524.1 hypothetical protein BCR33DRAFT_719478 [Rhizoclosmatium globosum]
MVMLSFSRKQIQLSKEEDEIQSNPNILPKLGSTLFLWSIMFSIIMNADWSEELRLGYGSLVVGCAMGCVLFWCLTVVLVELMAAFPFTGGTALYTRAAFGKVMGHIAAQCQIWELELNCVSSLINLVGNITSPVWSTMGTKYDGLWWAVCMVGCLAFIGISTRWFIRVICLLAVLEAAAFTLAPLILIPKVDIQWGVANASNTPIDQFTGVSTKTLFPTGIQGILQVLPIAVWVFLGIDGITLLSQETHNFPKSGPRAIVQFMATSTIIYFLQIIICPLVSPGVSKVGFGSSQTILTQSLMNQFPNSQTLIICVYSLIQNVIGLWASVHLLSRQMISLGYIRYWPSFVITTKYHMPRSGRLISREVPWFALLIESGWILITAAIQSALPFTPISVFIVTGASLYSIAVSIFLFLAYIRLRYVGLHRPIKYTFTLPCAILGLIIAGITVVVMAGNADYRTAFWICIAKLCVEVAIYLAVQWWLRKRVKRVKTVVPILLFSSDNVLDVGERERRKDDEVLEEAYDICDTGMDPEKSDSFQKHVLNLE